MAMVFHGAAGEGHDLKFGDALAGVNWPPLNVPDGIRSQLTVHHPGLVGHELGPGALTSEVQDVLRSFVLNIDRILTLIATEAFTALGRQLEAAATAVANDLTPSGCRCILRSLAR